MSDTPSKRVRKAERPDNLANFFAASPLRNSGLVFVRDKSPPRLPDFARARHKELPKDDEEDKSHS